MRGSAGHGDEGLKVLDLPFDGIGQGVAAVASTALVVVVHGEVLGQFHREWRVLRAVTDQNHGRSMSLPVVRDRRAVLRGHLAHSIPPRRVE